ncbi:MFS transporter [uncultured Hyphomonas sp.]|jgi:MFS family permease|uniref:MFS transporter n=1 Tax=uncultured Hyphomonas sp. TaxID=225298 RepID=UPI0030D8AB48|tara:strand:- start:37 stop:1281 length:1245 start_codon:yes stop_codon:yes gene_type:complete
MTDPDTPLLPLSGLQKAMIGIAMVAMGAGMSINFVVVAPLARKAGLTEIEVAGILTLSAAVYALLIPAWGRLADRFGRKRVMIFSLAAMGLTNMAFVFALNAALAGLVTGLTAFFTLVFVRIWFGLLSPGLQPAAMAAMTDATTPMTRAGGLGMLGACVSIGSILGPAGATVLAPFGALMPIWGTIVLNLAVAVILAIVLPATRKRPKTAKRPTPLAVRDPRVFPHLVFLFSYFIGIGIVQQTLSWFIEDRYKFVDTAGRSAGEAVVLHTGIAFACFAAGMIVVQFGYVQPRRPDPRKILPLGLAIVALGYVAADLFFPFWAVAISFLTVGGGAALAVPAANALGSLSVTREEQGAAAALLAAAPPSGFIFGPLIGATLYSFMPQLPLYVSAALIGSLAIYALLVTSKRPLTPS